MQTNFKETISVILPIFNEEGNMEPLIGEIIQALEPISPSFEVVCVDDCSTDRTIEVLRSLNQKDSRVVVLSHSRNFGQSAAQATGFRYAKGGIFITMDADRQNDPADIPTLLQAFVDTDCVCGIRRKRQDNRLRKIASKIGNGFRNWLTGDRIRDSGCTFRVMRRECLLEIPMFNGMHRFLPTLLRFQGRRVAEVEIGHRPRVWGKSKYGILNRAFRGLLDCMAIRWWKWRCFPQDRCRADK
jgi:glycosyltransferase involved in cell wall biosynthesis